MVIIRIYNDGPNATYNTINYKVIDHLVPEKSILRVFIEYGNCDHLGHLTLIPQTFLLLRNTHYVKKKKKKQI